MESATLPRASHDVSGASTEREALTRAVHLVERTGFGERTVLIDGALSVERERALALAADPALAEVRLSWARPGEPVRIVKALDVVEPRAKARGDGTTFPGWLSPARTAGRGTTHVLRGVAVLAAGPLPRAQEALIDMSGPGAMLSPFARTHNLVMEFAPHPDAPSERVDHAVRIALLRLAVHLAEAATASPPDVLERSLSPQGRAGERRRVAIITNLQTQGAFKDVFVYGRSMAGSLAALIEPGELDDGAVVSGQYGHPALRNPTYVHQNHPVLAAMASSEELELAGVLLCPEPVDQQGKELLAEHCARACAALGADAAIVTKEGGGNADADVSLKLDALAERGIAGVGLLAEMPGPDGCGPSLVFAPSRACGLVSVGSYDERVALGACERALGSERIDIAETSATAAVTLPVAAHLAALSPLGAGRITCAQEPIAG